MATSKCGHCGSFHFEIKLVEPNEARYKQYFVQCTSCGVPVGVLSYYDTGTKLKEHDGKFAMLESKLTDIEFSLDKLERALRK